MDNPIDRSLTAADENRVGGTLQDTRREFQREGISRPMAGETILDRLKTRFTTRPDVQRDQARSQTRR